MCDTVMNLREMGRTDGIRESLTSQIARATFDLASDSALHFQLLQAKRGQRQDGKCLETNRTGCQGSGQEKRSEAVSVGGACGWFGLAAGAGCPNMAAGGIGDSARWIPQELRLEIDWLCLRADSKSSTGDLAGAVSMG